MLLVEVVTDFPLAVTPTWRSPCLRPEERLARLGIYIFEIICKFGSIYQQLRSGVLLFLNFNHGQLCESVEHHERVVSTGSVGTIRRREPHRCDRLRRHLSPAVNLLDLTHAVIEDRLGELGVFGY